MKKKLYITRAIKLTAFFLLSALVIGVLQEYVLCHHDANRLRLDAFYIEDKETIDVALIGSSVSMFLPCPIVMNTRQLSSRIFPPLIKMGNLGVVHVIADM